LNQKSRYQQNIGGNSFFMPIEKVRQEKIQEKKSQPDKWKDKKKLAIAYIVHSEVNIVVQYNVSVNRTDKNKRSHPIDRVKNKSEQQKPQNKFALIKIFFIKKLGYENQAFFENFSELFFEHFFFSF